MIVGENLVRESVSNIWILQLMIFRNQKQLLCHFEPLQFVLCRNKLPHFQLRNQTAIIHYFSNIKINFVRKTKNVFNLKIFLSIWNFLGAKMMSHHFSSCIWSI